MRSKTATDFVDRSDVNMHLAWITAGLELANHVLSVVVDRLTDQDPVEDWMFIFHYVACYRCVTIIHRGLPYEFVVHVTIGIIAANLLYSDVHGFRRLVWQDKC